MGTYIVWAYLYHYLELDCFGSYTLVCLHYIDFVNIEVMLMLTSLIVIFIVDPHTPLI